jgi:hypothetical protein
MRDGQIQQDYGYITREMMGKIDERRKWKNVNTEEG